VYPNGSLQVTRYDQGASIFDNALLEDLTAGTFTPWDGLNHHIGLRTAKNGTSVDWFLYVDGALYRSGTLARSFTIADNCTVNTVPWISSQMPFGVGHVLFHDGAYTPPASHGQAVGGWIGETAGARITRLATEESVPLATIANQSLSMPMGPQSVQSFLAHVDECEAADMGVLCDPFDSFGMDYTVRADLYNMPVSLTLDHAQHQVGTPFAPVMDDLLRRNDSTVTRTNGGFGRYVGDTSRGVYPDTPTLNVASEGPLYNIAAWRVNLGTPRQRLRYPSLNVNYGRSTVTALAATWMASQGVPSRVQAVNLLSTMPPGSIDVLATGYTEVLAAKAWTMSILGVPYDPWNVGTLTNTLRLEMAGQTLAANLNPGATSLSLATAAGHQLFTTTALYPADFPLDLNVGGWQIHVTAATGGSSPQTLTITAAPNTTTVPSGTPVTLWRPAALAL
jgi:hypothetical protein